MSVVIADWSRGHAPYTPQTVFMMLWEQAVARLVPPWYQEGWARSQDRLEKAAPWMALSLEQQGLIRVSPHGLSLKPPWLQPLHFHKPLLSLPPGNTVISGEVWGISRRLRKGGRRRVLFQSFTHPPNNAHRPRLTELGSPSLFLGEAHSSTVWQGTGLTTARQM